MKPITITEKLKGRTPSILDEAQFRKHAILVPLLTKDNETHILFETRSMQLRSQPGDNCFPGGKIDQTDASPQFCAIRETTEELGITDSTITDVHPLDYMVTTNGRMLYPFAGILTRPEQIKPNPDEVAEVFTVPLTHFLTTPPDTYKIRYHVEPEADFPFDHIVGGEQYNWKTAPSEELFYYYQGHTIWGLTAKILHHFLSLIEA